MTVQDLELLRKISRGRKLQLRGKITPQKVQFLIGRISTLERRSVKPIRLNVASNGGDYWSALGLYDAIRDCRAPVYGVVSTAQCGALIVLQACDLRVGRMRSRYQATPVHHDLSIRVSSFSDPKLVSSVMEEHLSNTLLPYLKEAWGRAHQILLEQVLVAGKSEADLNQLLRHGEVFLSAEKALEWGFIEMVMCRP